MPQRKKSVHGVEGRIYAHRLLRAYTQTSGQKKPIVTGTSMTDSFSQEPQATDCFVSRPGITEFVTDLIFLESIAGRTSKR